MSWIIEQINNNQYLFFLSETVVRFELMSEQHVERFNWIELNGIAYKGSKKQLNGANNLTEIGGWLFNRLPLFVVKSKMKWWRHWEAKKKEEEEGGGGGGGGITVPEANVALNQTENNSIRIFHSFGVDVSFNLPSRRPKIDKNQMLPTTINIPRRFQQQQQQQQLPHKVSIKPARKPTAICNLMNDKWRQNATE